jgi:hypothetical protein
MSDFCKCINHALASYVDSNSSSESDTSSDDSQSVPSSVISLSSAPQPDEISNCLQRLLVASEQLSEDSDTSDGSDNNGFLSSNLHILSLIGQPRGHRRNNDAVLRILSEVASSPHHAHPQRPQVVSSEESNSDSQPSAISDGGDSRTEDEFVPDLPAVELNGEEPDRDYPTYLAG